MKAPRYIRKDYQEPSVFTPENLLREARRQKAIPIRTIPRVCVLDPDGDIVKYLCKNHLVSLDEAWACYHTKLYSFKIGHTRVGIVGCAVGASFSVLVAEEMFASGCKLLFSITSAGRIGSRNKSIRFLLIAKSIRDEGTSYNYLPPSIYSNLNKFLLKTLTRNLQTAPTPIVAGTSWTTDAPFRETKSAIAYAEGKSAVCVEMEAAALYAFAKARHKKIICFANLTNSMAQTEGDFEKGTENGSIESLKIIKHILKVLKFK